MRKAKRGNAHRAKSEGYPYPIMEQSSDVIAEGWSAEHIAEESVYLDITEVKEEMIEGKWVMRINRSARIFVPPSFDHRR
jgi:hypothetical protein